MYRGDQVNRSPLGQIQHTVLIEFLKKTDKNTVRGTLTVKRKVLPTFLAMILNPHFNYLVFKLLVAIYILMALIFELKSFVCINVSKSNKHMKNHKQTVVANMLFF